MRSNIRTRLDRLWGVGATPLGLVGLVTLVFWVALVSDQVAVRNAAVTLLIYIVLVVGLYSFVGPSGIMSFGHAGFMAIGAYVAALLAMPTGPKQSRLPGLPTVIQDGQFTLATALAVAALASLVFALVSGAVLMRLSGLAAGIATLALMVVVHVIVSQWSSVTAGPGSLVGIPVRTTATVAWVIAVLAIAVVSAFQQSSTGLKLRASREDDLAAQASGVRIYSLRVFAFALSAVIVGVGGGLFALRVSVLSPGAVYLDVTFLTIAMLVVGGMRSLTGAVLGVVVLSVVSEAVRQLEAGFQLGAFTVPELPGLRQIAVALILLVVLALRPNGLTGGRELHQIIKPPLTKGRRGRRKQTALNMTQP